MQSLQKLLLNISLYLSLFSSEPKCVVKATSFKCTDLTGTTCKFIGIHLAGPENTFYSRSDPDAIRTVIFEESELQILPNQIFTAFPYTETLIAMNASINAFNYHAFTYAGELKRLNVSYNDVQTLVKSSFEGAHKLEVLNMTNNGMQSIGQGTFSYLVYLKYLDLSYNLLQSLPKMIFDSNPQLIEVELSHNRFFYVDPTIFHHNPNLHYLYLDGNRIKDLSLLFSVNSLYHIEIELNGMKHLSLSASEITYPTLKLSIYAFSNELEKISIKNFHVRAMSLFNNSIRNLDFLCDEAFKTTERLNLERNYIKILNYGCINRMSKLYELNISENQIRDFDTELLSPLKNLKILYTFGNQLHLDVKEIADNFPEIKIMDISSHNNHTRPIIVHTETNMRPLVKKSATNSASISSPFNSISTSQDIDKPFNVSIFRLIYIFCLFFMFF